MKIIVYSKTGCKNCETVKKELSGLGIEMANEHNWTNGTWIERDAEKLIDGTIDGWRDFPDVEVLSFISSIDSVDVPILWIDDKCYKHPDGMDIIRNEFGAGIKNTTYCDKSSCKLIA